MQYLYTKSALKVICVNLNVHLSGVMERIVSELVKQGYAASKTEAIRLSLLEFSNKHRIIEAVEEEQLLSVAEKRWKQVESGTSNSVSEKELRKFLRE